MLCSLRCVTHLLLHYALLLSIAASIKVSVFGASGGIGQLVTKRLVGLNVEVNAITRSAAETQEKFGTNLAGSTIIQADARDLSTIPNTIRDVDFIVLTMGTYSLTHFLVNLLICLLTQAPRHFPRLNGKMIRINQKLPVLIP